jgi:hypothetical protein
MYLGTVTVGGAVGGFGMENASVAPATNPTTGGVLYAAAGTLKWKSQGGIIFSTVQAAAAADTSGATLANLELEVNKLKALLRASGQLAP